MNLPRGLLRAGWRDLVRRPLQALLMLLGVALGVAVIVAIDLANQSARRSFALSTEALIGRATHRIEGGPAGLPQEIYRQLKVDSGFRDLAPVVQGLGVATDLDSLPVRLLGIDPFAEPPFRDLIPTPSVEQADFSPFLLDPASIIVSENLARRYGLDPGDSIRIQVNAKLVTFRILGVIVPPEGDPQEGLSDVIVMDIASAQEALDMPQRLSRIDVIASDKTAQMLREELPGGVRLQPSGAQRETLDQLAGAFQLNLQALSLLALVVGMFLIYNTTMFSVVQRRQVLGIFRTLGATGRQVAAMILLEAFWVAAAGAALGIVFGWLLGKGAVRLTTQTINDLYYVLDVQRTQLSSLSILKGAAAGIGAGLLAAIGPAAEAANVAPVVVMRRSRAERGAQHWVRRAFFAGLGLVSMGIFALIMIPGSLAASFVGLFFILLGLALLVPRLTILFTQLIQPFLVHFFGSLGRIAAGTVRRSLSRTSVAVAALMVSLSVAIGVGIMISSFRTTVVEWLNLTLRADIYISTPALGGARPTASLPPELKPELAGIDGVKEIETVRTVQVDSAVGEVLLLAVDAQRARSGELYRFAEGTSEQVWQKVQQGAVIVSEPFAYRHDIPAQGGSLSLETDRGEAEFQIVGIYYDYTVDSGTVLMSQDTYRRFWDDEAISSLAVFTAPGEDIRDLADRLRQELSGTGLQVQLNRTLREQALAIFNRTFMITSALRILAVIVAFIGVLSAFMALMLERRREFATMQAIGLTGCGLWRLTFLETGIMGTAAGLFAIPTGVVLAVILIYVINLRSFGWTINFQAGAGIYLSALATAILAALLAGIYPGWRLQRLSVAENLAQE
jgi:putative ABC transport system permease protein